MKPNSNNRMPDSGSPLSRPPPFVHPTSEPEYDTEQLARRAAEVTDVLEHILEEHPAPPDPPLGPLAPVPGVPPPSL